MAHRTLSIALVILLMTAPAVPAQQQQQQSSAAPVAAQTTDKAIIAGSVLDQDSKPLPDARVRLRNLRTSNIEQTSSTDRKGEFRFVADPDTPYLVELVDSDGGIVSVSDVVTLHKGEVSGTVLIAASRSSFAHFFGITAGALAAALSGLGITTIQDAPPLSPEK